MDRAIIFGTGLLAELVYYHVYTTEQIKVDAFVLTQPTETKQCQGLPVVQWESAINKYPKETHGIYVCIGYNNMNAGRKAIFDLCDIHGYTILSYLHPSVQVDTPHIGRGTIALQNTVFDAYSQVGQGNIFNANTLVAHNCTMGDFNFMAGGSMLAGVCTVTDFCYLGLGAIVRDNVTLGHHTLLGAAAYAAKDTEPYQVVVPARGTILPGRKSIDFM